MLEIRVHGRGGQGSVVTSEMLAIAAFHEGKYSQAFPYLGGGGERRGAPVQAFCRIDDRPIELKCRVRRPDYLIVQDVSLVRVVNILDGLKDGGVVLFNSTEDPRQLGVDTERFRLHSFPATEIALEILGKPVMNTAMIGAFAALTGLFAMESLAYAINRKFSGEIGLLNVRVMERSFNLAKKAFEGCAAHEA